MNANEANETHNPGKPITEMTLEEYLALREAQTRSDAQVQLAAWQKAANRANANRRAKALRQVAAWTEHIAGLDAHLTRLRPKFEREYRRIVLKAIRRGEAISQHVLDADETFRKAVTGYERYCKARVTSFSNTKNALPVAASGYKIKVQSGKPVTLEHFEHIETGMREIQMALTAIGVACDLPAMASHVGLTIVHTDGKHPFLKRASGLYVVGERTISTGTMIGGRLLRSLAHEFAHMLDYEAGRATHGREKALTDSLVMTRGEPIAPILLNAGHLLNRGSEADILFKRIAGQLATTDEERMRLRWNRARLGAYWHRTVEIWARLVEQRFASALPSAVIAYDPDYSEQMAYWPDERVLEWAPVIDATLARMVKVILAEERRLE
jgi:hypothetical protein